MKLSRKIRQQARTIAAQAVEIDALKARVAAGSADWHRTQDALHRLRNRHKVIAAPALYGRRGATEARCAECTTSPYPCHTRKTLDGLLG